MGHVRRVATPLSARPRIVEAARPRLPPGGRVLVDAVRFPVLDESSVPARVVCGRGRNPTLRVSRYPWSRCAASGILRSGSCAPSRAARRGPGTRPGSGWAAGSRRPWWPRRAGCRPVPVDRVDVHLAADQRAAGASGRPRGRTRRGASTAGPGCAGRTRSRGSTADADTVTTTSALVASRRGEPARRARRHRPPYKSSPDRRAEPAPDGRDAPLLDELRELHPTHDADCLGPVLDSHLKRSLCSC